MTLQDNNEVQIETNLESFSFSELSHGNSEPNSLPEATVAAVSADPDKSANVEIPSDFYSAIEAASMSGTTWDMRPHVLDKKSG